MTGMDDKERYLFDLMGYLVVEDVLSAAEVDELNRVLDELDLWSGEGSKVERRWVYEAEHKVHVGMPYEWHDAFRRVVSHPRIVPYLVELCGPQVRFDHDYVILAKPGGDILSLHGGGADPYQDVAFYRCRNGRMHNGLIVVSLALGDVAVEDGGFVAVPGSHKSSLPFPDGHRDMDAAGPWLQRVPQKAGSAIIFTEALTHGTARWTADRERRSLLCKYSPGSISWLRDYPGTDYIPDAEVSEELRVLLEPPYREGHPAVVTL
jgi:ectoine hydroxylase-related dioxygenase (phytanoyl-CoA dioxygenase family)